MSRGSRIVDQYRIVQNVWEFYIAMNGVVNSVAEGYVAQSGIIRQFWPPNIGDDDIIVMTTDTELSYATKMAGEGAAIALCSWDARSGRLILSDEYTVRYVDVLAPAPRGAGVYLLRVELVSGDVTLEFPTGEWHDVFEYGNLGVFSNYLINGFAVSSVVNGEVTVSVAEDDGAGAPKAGTVVSKTVEMKAEIVGANLPWTTAPWTLTSIRYNEFAGVILLTVPAGYGDANEAFITGNTFQDIPPFDDDYKEVIREIYAVEWGLQFTVQVDVISGAVTGDPTGIPLSTALKRTWEVSAPDPLDSNSATVDVTISDGVSSVTKRVYMAATQLADNNDAGSGVSTDFTRYDIIEDNWEEFYPTPMYASVALLVNPDGTVTSVSYTMQNNTNFPQDWNTLAPSAPDPQNFECRMTILSGDPLQTNFGITGVWQNLSVQRFWEYWILAPKIDPDEIREVQGDWQLEIREVGRPETVKTKLLHARAYIVGPPGEPPP